MSQLSVVYVNPNFTFASNKNLILKCNLIDNFVVIPIPVGILFGQDKSDFFNKLVSIHENKQTFFKLMRLYNIYEGGAYMLRLLASIQLIKFN